VLKKIKSPGLIGGSATYLLSNVLSAAAPFLLLPVLTRYLHPEEYGRIAMFQTAQAAFAAVIGLSVVGAAGRKYYDANLNKEEHKFFIGACFLILAVTTSIALFVLMGFEDAFASMSGLDGSWLIASAFCAAFGFIQQMRMTQWQMQKQSGLYAAMQIGASVCLVAFSLLFVIALAKGAAGRVIAQVVSSLIFGVLALAFLYKDGLLGFAWRPAYIREALSFGAPLIPHSIGILLLGYCDRVVINDQLGLAEAGAYTVAFQLASVFGMVTFAINNAYVPWLFERLQRDDPQEKREIVKWTYWYFAIALALAGAVFVVGPFAINLIAGERYDSAAPAIGWLALTQAFAGMYLMVTNYILYSKKTGLLSLVTIGSGALDVALLFALTSRFGLAGAGMAGAIAMAARFLFTWRVAQLRHPMPWFNLKTA
jgi:O-antigen/teichoic acid export membrane protein